MSSTEKSLSKKEGSVRETNDIQTCRVTEVSQACSSSHRKGYFLIPLEFKVALWVSCSSLCISFLFLVLLCGLGPDIRRHLKNDVKGLLQIKVSSWEENEGLMENIYHCFQRKGKDWRSFCASEAASQGLSCRELNSHRIHMLKSRVSF